MNVTKTMIRTVSIKNHQSPHPFPVISFPVKLICFIRT